MLAYYDGEIKLHIKIMTHYIFFSKAAVESDFQKEILHACQENFRSFSPFKINFHD